jgi:uncharacterized alpha/beta hydrolase family protein
MSRQERYRQLAERVRRLECTLAMLKADYGVQEFILMGHSFGGSTVFSYIHKHQPANT